MRALIDKIKQHEAQVAVIGIGYVGLPLAVEVAKAGFTAVGYDKSADKVAALNEARSYIGDISDDDLAPARAAIKPAIAPAPMPLSMLTTASPGAHV